jgi:hypothetical protein
VKRLLAIVLLALALAGCRYVPPATHVYCYGEGGQVPICVSQGSEGRP